MKKNICISLVFTLVFLTFGTVFCSASEDIIEVYSQDVTKSGKDGKSVKGVDWDRDGKDSLPGWSGNGGYEMAGGSWGRYAVTVPKAGVYEIYAKAGNNSGQENNMSFETGNYVAEIKIPNNGDLWGTVSNDRGYVYLKEGENIIIATNMGPSYHILWNFMLEKTDDSYMDCVKIKNINIPAGNVTKSGEDGNCERGTDWYRSGKNDFPYWNGAGFEMTRGSWGRYHIDVPKSGLYTVVAKAGNTAGEVDELEVKTEDGSSVSTGKIEPSNDNWGKENHNFTTIELNEGENIIIITNKGPNYFVLHYVALKKAESIRVDKSSLQNGGTIPRGTENFEFVFNCSLKDVNVTLKADDGSEIPVETNLSENNLDVYLKDTLDFEKSYNITINNIVPVESGFAYENDISYDFITSAQLDDSGVSKVSIDKYSYDNVNKKIKVSGNVKSGKDIFVAGRKVYIKDDTNENCGECITDDNGEFLIEYDFSGDDAANEKACKYKFTVVCEYSDEVNLEMNYISKNLENEILNSIKLSKTPKEINQIFDTKYNELGIFSYISDIRTIIEKSTFYNYFVGKDFNNLEEFCEFYNKNLSMESLNQLRAKTVSKRIVSMIEKIIGDKNECDKIGIDYNKIVLIKNNRDKFIEEFILSEKQVDYGSFIKDFNSLMNKWLVDEFEINDSIFVISNKSANLGEKIVFPFSISTSDYEIEKINITITSSEEDIFKSAEYVNKKTDNNLDIKGKVINLTSKFKENSKEFGEFTFIMPREIAYTLDFSGSVTYKLLDNVFMDIPINEKSVVISIKEISVTPERPSGGGGGNWGGSSYVPSKKEENEPASKPVENNYEYFSDLENHKWAEDMINALVNKNIISEKEDKKFRPQDNITREEFIKMIITAIGSYDKNSVTNLTDVPNNHWATSYIASAQKNGSVKGNDKNEFGIGQNITREDMAVIIFRVFEKLEVKNKNPILEFSDYDEISDYAKQAVEGLSSFGIINGVGNNKFAPKYNATRAEAAKMIYKMLEVLGL